MHLVPTHEDVVTLLRSTGGLREGHFEYNSGLHSNEYLQVALTMRYYDAAKILSVGLSRKLRAHTEIRAMIPELSIVAPATGGLPVAYGVCEALRARQVYWAERENEHEPQRFRQYLELQKGEKVLLVDDILRTGTKLAELEEAGGIERRGSGRARRSNLSAQSQHAQFRSVAVLLSGGAERSWQVLQGRFVLRAVQARNSYRQSLGSSSRPQTHMRLQSSATSDSDAAHESVRALVCASGSGH